MGSLYIFLASVLGTTIIWFYKRMTVEEQEYIFVKHYEKTIYKFVYTLVFTIFVFLSALLINSIFQPDNFLNSIIYDDQGKFTFLNFLYLISGLVISAITILGHMVPEMHFKSDDDENYEKHMKSLRERLDMISSKQDDFLNKLELEYTERKATKERISKDGKFWKTVKKYKIMVFLFVLSIFTTLLFVFESDVINYVFIGVYIIIIFQRLEPIVADIIDLPTVKILETIQVDDINDLIEKRQLEPVSYYNNEIILYSTEVFGSYILFNTNTGFLVRYLVDTTAVKEYAKTLLLAEQVEESLSENEEKLKEYLVIKKEVEDAKETIKNQEEEIEKLRKTKETLESK